MDTSFPNQSVNKNTRLPIILLIAIFVVLLFGVLTYLKIIPLQNFIRSTSNQPTPISTTKTGSVNTNPIKIHCPTIKAVCDQGYGVFENQTFFGLGYKLAAKNPIYAAFDGTLTATTSSFQQVKDEKIVQKTLIIVYLDNPEINRKAVYYFRGSVDKNDKVQKGEQIATSNGKQISIYDNSSLVFSLFLGDSNKTSMIINNDIFE